MIGVTRFALAWLVVLNHVWLPTANKVGAHAVIAFYAVSGYLMTKVLAEVYSGPSGLWRYALNRFLRIFPVYWLVVLLTVAFMLVTPSAFGNLNSAIKLPDGADPWLRNLTLVALTEAPTRLVPPAWSLTIECFFYMAMGLLLSRSATVTTVWFGASVAFTAYLVWTGAPFGERYTPVEAASLYFSTGALTYHLRDWLGRLRLPLPAFWLLLLGFCSFPLVVEHLGGDRFMLGYYGAFLLFLPLLFASISNRPVFDDAVDRFLGDLAYPIFLAHFFALGLVRLVSGSRLTPMGVVEMLLAVVVTLILGVVVVRFVDPAVQRLRDQVRRGARRRAASDVLVAPSLSREVR